jgi:hypothetical protein
VSTNVEGWGENLPSMNQHVYARTKNPKETKNPEIWSKRVTEYGIRRRIYPAMKVRAVLKERNFITDR